MATMAQMGDTMTEYPNAAGGRKPMKRAVCTATISARTWTMDASQVPAITGHRPKLQAWPPKEAWCCPDPLTSKTGQKQAGN